MFKAPSGDAWPGCEGGASKCGPCLSTWPVLRANMHNPVVVSDELNQKQHTRRGKDTQ